MWSNIPLRSPQLFNVNDRSSSWTKLLSLIYKHELDANILLLFIHHRCAVEAITYASSHFRMAQNQTNRMTHNGLISAVHIVSSIYFTLLTSRVVLDYFDCPLSEAHDKVFDILPILCFFTSMITYSFSTIYIQVASLENEVLETLTVLTLIWASSLPFLYYQFYHTTALLATLLFAITFASVWLASFVLAFHNTFEYKWASFALGALASLPALYATSRPSACRYSLAGEYVQYSILNGIGGLVCFLKLPERCGHFVHSNISRIAMHLAIVVAAVRFTTHLVSAYVNSVSSFSTPCGIWKLYALPVSK